MKRTQDFSDEVLYLLCWAKLILPGADAPFAVLKNLEWYSKRNL